MGYCKNLYPIPHTLYPSRIIHPMTTSLDTLNAMSLSDFVNELGGIFEHSPWVALGAYARRPFGMLEQLHSAMTEVVEKAGEDKQLALIRAHPDLAGKAALAGDLTEHSKSEQTGAGLDKLSKAEYQRFHDLNNAYKEKFGFPFILAVKGHTKDSILESFEKRLPHTPDAERKTALKQIYKIAGLRLEALLGV
jgi:2-oxo-4-hydroxy-4-carboxy-5-ureidoimidazoline decarboxylase